MGASCGMRCHTWVLLVFEVSYMHGCFLWYEVSFMGASCGMRCHTWVLLVL